MKNKGMYIEQLIDKTINYYIDNNICLIERRFLPIKIIKKEKDTIIGKLLSKSYVDFFGMYKTKFITFETKQCNDNIFNLNLLKKHQYEHMQFVWEKGGLSFLIVHFFDYDETFLVLHEQINNWFKSKNRNIDIQEFKKNINIYNVQVIFPGILDLVSVLENIIK